MILEFLNGHDPFTANVSKKIYHALIFSKNLILNSEFDIVYFIDCKFKKEFPANVLKYQEDHPSSKRGCAFVAVYIHAIQNAWSGLSIYVELSVKDEKTSHKRPVFLDISENQQLTRSS